MNLLDLPVIKVTRLYVWELISCEGLNSDMTLKPDTFPDESSLLSWRLCFILHVDRWSSCRHNIFIFIFLARAVQWHQRSARALPCSRCVAPSRPQRTASWRQRPRSYAFPNRSLRTITPAVSTCKCFYASALCVTGINVGRFRVPRIFRVAVLPVQPGELTWHL